MNIHSIFRPFQRYFLKEPMLYLWQLFDLTVESSILDIGGNEFNGMLFKSSSNVILLNLEVQERRSKCNLNWVIADGRNLPFKDDAFELVYSNSVIEHLGSIDRNSYFQGNADV